MELFHLPLPLLLLLLLPHNAVRGDSLRSDRPAGAAAAAPLLQGRPFVVVWNLPTARCHQRYGVQLDLADFDIVENRHQRFQGQNMTIFYRDHLGMYPYLSRDGEAVNGGVPQRGDLGAHLSLAAAQLSGSLRPNFTGVAVIDWEEWRPLWGRNFGSKSEYRRLSELLVRRERPGLSEEGVTALARRRFEEGARRFMAGTLQLAVGGCPKGLWGFYGLPACFNKRKRKTERAYTGRCHRGTREKNDQLSWLWSRSTALFPSIYLPRSLAGSQDAALMVRHRLLEALRVASLWRHGNKGDPATPVLPYARLAFAHSLHFLNKTDLEHTLGQSAALGAAGVVLWGEVKFARSKQQCILLRDYVRSVLGPYIRSLRSDTQRCSLQLCGGNGRCVRRHPGAGRGPPSALGAPRRDAGPLADSFMCRCYAGWTGQECQRGKKSEDV